MLLKRIKKSRLNLIFVIIIICNNLFPQTTYYVSNDGDDANNGLSESNPIATLTKVNSLNLQPGDVVLFKKGDIWRTPNDSYLNNIESGQPDNYIKFGAYGTGIRPRILGSITSSSWTDEGNNIWSTDDNIPTDPYGLLYTCQIYFELKNDSVAWGIHYSTIGELSQEYDWTFSDNKVYVYSISDPSLLYKSIEMPQETSLCLTGGAEYIHFDQIEFAYTANMAIRDPYNSDEHKGLIVSNCWIHHIGNKDSGQAFGLSIKHSLTHIHNNEFNDCGRRAVSIHLYETFENAIIDSVIIENNLFGTGDHTLGIDIGNDGGTNDTIRSIWIRNNVFKGNPYRDHSYGNPGAVNANTVYIVCDNSGGCHSENFYFYNNIILYPEGYAGFQGIYGLYIDHNTAYGNTQIGAAGNQNIFHFSRYSGHRLSENIYMRNNLVDNSMPNSINNFIYALEISEGEESQFTMIDYNLWWCEDDGQQMIKMESGGSDDFYYRDDNGGTRQDLSDWTANYGFGANSPTPADPAFRDRENEVTPWDVNEYRTVLLPDLAVESTSSAVNAGTPVNWISTDFWGYNRDPLHPTIGAIEFDSVPQETNINLNSYNSAFEIYPNPVSDILNIRINIDKYTKGYTLNLYNIQGRMISKSNTLFTQEYKLYLQELPRGVYILSIEMKNGIKAYKKITLKN